MTRAPLRDAGALHRTPRAVTIETIARAGHSRSAGANALRPSRRDLRVGARLRPVQRLLLSLTSPLLVVVWSRPLRPWPGRERESVLFIGTPSVTLALGAFTAV